SIHFDDHLAVRCLVEGVDGRLADMLGECRAGIGLQPPANGRLRLHIRGGECSRADCARARGHALAQEIALADVFFRHIHPPVRTLPAVPHGLPSVYLVPDQTCGSHMAISGKIMMMIMVST